ncbi:amylo-alpha-1,6-glucosidase [Croceitalea rosinachiae]|uniref:Glycogen debranching protein n=1 Tax=Croceitalea rosinachiae TaxID=3075596 RepID=A0ABU3ACI1_9FLAO|nr:glycogen debranching protein [Croceitalea sp. F388]MDT0607886.1 glycogen debranching protein [Croceitalea sp. F388]
MTVKPILTFSCFILFLIGCTEKKETTFSEMLKDEPSIIGKTKYLTSPYVTAGNRIYMVGHQDGSFPELGWHVKGEMGGIWNHPIKLMDGFDIHLNWADESYSLNSAHSFTNYPYTNKHHFLINEKALEIERWQFVPDDNEGLVVQIHIINKGVSTQSFSVDFVGHSDLRPTWLGERTDMIDSQDLANFNDVINGWVVKDEKNPWFVCYNSQLVPERTTNTNQKYKGNGVSNALSYSITLKPNESKTITFAIAGSYKSEKAAITTLHTIQNSLPTLVKKKKNRYQKLANQTKLNIPDKRLEQTFEWLKYNCDWLVRTVPEIGTGITAGIPDYPWWFGVDSEYALQGYMAVGQEDAVYKTIKLLDSVSEAVNGNGKIIHEMSTNGAVFNDGNINETPQFATLIWRIYQWNGDKAFLEEYFPTIEKGLKWLMDTNDLDKNGFPEGFGMMEIHGLDSEMIDVAVYTQKAFADAAKIADILEKKALANTYEAVAANLKDKINTDFWSEDFNSYADFIGTDEQTLHLIEDAIIRADTLKKPWSIAEMEQTKQFVLDNPSDKPRPFVLHHNWVVNTPMEMGIADNDKALRALETAKNYVNPFGVFVTGIDRDESAGSNENTYIAPPIFTYTGAVMTLPTGVSAIAENNYGRPNEALDYLERMTRSFSYALPGSMYEVSPDFGMMAQAWNIYSYAYPIVHQFFGIQPNAAEKEVVISPQMPDMWNEASLENIKIGDNEISVYYAKNNGKPSIKVKQTNTDWNLILKTIHTKQPKDYKGEIAISENETIVTGQGETISITY